MRKVPTRLFTMRTRSEPLFILGEIMKIKEPKTIEEQIEILKSRGLIIEDENFAKKVLMSANYYNLTGYSFPFLQNEQYSQDITFNKLYKIYMCDKRIKSIVLYALDIIEHNLKTIFAYNLAHTLGPLCYKDIANYNKANEYNVLITKFDYSVRQNRNLPFVAHHISKYDGEFPIWVAIELFSMGMLKNMFNNIKRPTRKLLAIQFSTGISQLSSWLDCIVRLRNMCAHYLRIYDYNFSLTPKKCDNLFSDEFQYSNKLFDIMYVMKFLSPDKNEWNNYVLSNIKQIFDEYTPNIEIIKYGFPENWEKILKK